MPFSMSGVPLKLSYKAVGLEREVSEIVQIFRKVVQTGQNTLIVIVAPYGYGKSELLNQLEKTVGKAVRIALTLSIDVDPGIIERAKTPEEPLLILIDEADEVARLVEMHKLGALSDENFRSSIIRLSTLIRALIEPENYPHIWKDPSKIRGVLVVIATTPQLYFGILRNVVPDVFDIARGRVYKVFELDTRIPLWLFTKIVEEKLKTGKGPSFGIEDIAAIYHTALRKGDTSPRYLEKLMAKAIEYRERGSPIYRVFYDELGIDPNELDETTARALASGIPISVEKHIPTLVKVRITRKRVSQSSIEELSSLLRDAVSGGLRIRDLRDLSMEPFTYYTRPVGNDIEVVVVSRDGEEEAYIPAPDIRRKVLGDQVDLSSIRAWAEEIVDNQRLLASTVNEILGFGGLPKILCCGMGYTRRSNGIREALLVYLVSNFEELEQVVEELAHMVKHGKIADSYIDTAFVIIVSKYLLTGDIAEPVGHLAREKWKTVYSEDSDTFTKFVIYGAENIDKLIDALIDWKLARLIGKKISTELDRLVDTYSAWRGASISSLSRYVIRRRSKERKELALIKMVKSPDEPLLNVINGIMKLVVKPVQIRTLEKLLEATYPTEAWELKPRDVIRIANLMGKVVILGDTVYPFSPENAYRHLLSLADEIRSKSRIIVETPGGKLEFKLAEPLISKPTNEQDYSSQLISLTQLLSKLDEEVERVKAKLSVLRDALTLMPQRITMVENIDASSLDQVIEREAELARHYREALKLANQHLDALRLAGLDRHSIEEDLEMLTQIPEPPLNEYVTLLKTVLAKLDERLRKELRRIEAAKWLSSKLGIVVEPSRLEDVVAELSKELRVPPQAILYLASKGPGREVTGNELKAVGIDDATEVLERLAAAGLLTKRYFT